MEMAGERTREDILKSLSDLRKDRSLLLSGSDPGATKESIMSPKKTNLDWFSSLRDNGAGVGGGGGYAAAQQRPPVLRTKAVPGASGSRTLTENGAAAAESPQLSRSTSDQLPLESTFRTKNLTRGPGPAPVGFSPRSPRPAPNLPMAFAPTEVLKKEARKAQSRVLPVKEWNQSLKEHGRRLDEDSMKSYKNMVQQRRPDGSFTARPSVAFTQYSSRSKHTGLDEVSVNELTHTIHQGGFVDGAVLKRSSIMEKSAPLRVKDWSTHLRS